MPVALETVVKQLEDSGIVAAGKLENFVPPKAHPSSVEALVGELVKQNHLTKFQAQQVAAGKVKALIVGNYTILDKIGAGGMGQVFKAEHRRMERIVAIKMLPPAMTKDAMAVARFHREVKAAAKLEHPNIVAAHDADEANGAHFLVMQFVDGQDLSALVKKNGPFSAAKAINYVLQAAKGLEFAHGEGVIHRDIKPANLLLDKKGTVKILDMGLARIEAAGNVAAQAELTGTGAVMGTVDYMAPEQGMSTKHADARADIYSLGCTFFYLLIGKATYDGETVAAKLVAHHNDPIPELRKLRGEVPEQVEAVFKKMVAKKIDDRYQTMGEVIADLEKCQTAIVGEAASTATGVWQSAATVQPDELSIALGNQSLKSIGDADFSIQIGEPNPKKIVHPSSEGGFKNRKPLLIGAGAAGFFALLLGVIVILRNQKGEEVGRMELPDGTSVEVKATAMEAERVAANKHWNTPAFQQWMKDVQALPAEKQIEAVKNRLMELNPGYDGKVTSINGKGPPKIVKGMVTELKFFTANVTDISPVRALTGLTDLTCAGSDKVQGLGKLSDLSPLDGMSLTKLECFATLVADLSPISGMKLTVLNFSGTPVSDLSPLKGMPLTTLLCVNTYVSDLSPLEGMNLTKIGFTPNNITNGLQAIRQMNTLNAVVPTAGNEHELAPAEFWKKYDAGEFGKPTVAVQPWNTPAFQQWVKATQALPAEQQSEAVSKKLAELNPGFDGKLTGPNRSGPPNVQRGVVTQLSFVTDHVTDISPVRAFVGLTFLRAGGDSGRNGVLSNLLPLKGMQLTKLEIHGNFQLNDLSPLQDCKNLTTLLANRTNVTAAQVAALQKALPKCKIEWDGPANAVVDQSDKPWNTPAFQAWVKTTQALSAEKQIEAVSKKLMELNPGFDGTITPKIVKRVVTDLTFVVDNVTDLSPVRAVSGLIRLNCSGSLGGRAILSDLSPLRDLPLTTLRISNTQVADLLPLQAMPLTTLDVHYTQVVDLSPLQGMKLAGLFCESTLIADLSPLQGMPLTILNCGGTKVSDLSPLRSCTGLEEAKLRSTKVTAAGVAALQKALPNCMIEWDDPAKPKTPEPAASGTK